MALADQINRVWRGLTAPQATDKDQARREYMTTAILVMMGVALLLFTLPILLGWVAGLFDLESVAIMAVMNTTIWGGWWLTRHGHWRWARYVPPAVFYLLPVYGLRTSERPIVLGLLFFAIAILLTGMLHGIRSQWYMVALCTATYALSEWALGTGLLEDLLSSVIMVSGSFVGIALLLWFFTTLLTRANNQLEQEIAERKRAEGILRASTEKIRAMFRSITDSITFTDLQGNIVELNEAAVRLHGFRDKTDAIGKSAFDFIAERDRARAQRGLQETLATGQGGLIEYLLLARDGREFDAELSAVLLRDERGDPTGFVALTRDITERKRAEQERTRLLAQVQEQARQVRQIMDTVPDGVVLLTHDHTVLLANPAGQRHLTLLAHRLVGDTLTALGQRPVVELLDPPEKGDWHEIRAKGRTFEVIARPTSLILSSSGWVLVIRDMTREREMQTQMRHQERMASLGQLTGGIAHYFNNLLTGIRGYAQLAIDDLGSPDFLREDLQEIKKGADRAAALIRQLLAFSRQQILRPQMLDLNALIRNLGPTLQRLIGEHSELHTSLARKLDPVEADPAQLEQVILNLAANARDAMPDGGRLSIETAHVELDEAWARQHPEGQPGAHVLLAVSDTGFGMDDEVLKHLFEPFFTTKDVGQGTGLGLATVHGIIVQSGGHIQVDSQPGQGTTFRIYLPRASGGKGLG